MQQISADTWPLFQNDNGRIVDEYSVRKWTFYKGISDSIQSELWKFFLNYYPFSSTAEERSRIDEEKRQKYETLLATWRSPQFTPHHKFSDYERVIEKDSWRTDRHLEYYHDDNNEHTQQLLRILKTFITYDPEMGYVQGMNDILSPLLMVLGTEHEAFWCFTEVMRKMESTFRDLTLSQPLRGLARLCWYLDTQLYDHIDGVYEGEDWIFCYRWILLNFKREFEMEEICTLWERIWSNHATTHFLVFFAAAVLIHFRSQLLLCTSVEACMQFSMQLSGSIPLTRVLSLAQSLLEQLRNDEYCPHELRYLISSSGCAPPPLVGFVRARQTFSSLHSNKISLQRDQIWKSLFGETPVQPVTSPFLLSPVRNQSNTLEMTSPRHNHTASQRTNRECKGTSSGQQNNDVQEKGSLCSTTTVTVSAPPKEGFVPREKGIEFREDIRTTARRLSGLFGCEAAEGRSSSQERTAHGGIEEGPHVQRENEHIVNCSVNMTLGLQVQHEMANYDQSYSKSSYQPYHSGIPNATQQQYSNGYPQLGGINLSDPAVLNHYTYEGDTDMPTADDTPIPMKQRLCKSFDGVNANGVSMTDYGVKKGQLLLLNFDSLRSEAELV